jgi:single-strand DNA-binding protein
MSVNKVILLGYVGNDPEIRNPEKDMTVATFSLATNERQGQSQTEVTEWHSIVMFGKSAEFAEKYIRKGTRLYLEGRLRTREYEDRFKIRRRKTEIIVDNFELLGRKQDSNLS